MRTKEFIIFIVIFTILYIVFFVVYDKLMDKKLKKETRERAKSLIIIDQYIKFASFYGIKATANAETILKIYDFQNLGKDCTISKEAASYNITNLEYVVIVLYLEYLTLINKRIISIDLDLIKHTTFVEQNMMQKYVTYFQNKTSFDDITSVMGKNASNDLTLMDKQFLMPGVRFINSKLYYVGDYL